MTTTNNMLQAKVNGLAEKNVLNFFASLSDETRIHIILSLAEKAKTVNEIHEFIGKDKMTLSAISHQLRQLLDVGIVYYEKVGKERRYQLSDKFCWCILRDAFEQFNKHLKIRCKKCKK
ncbi:winged helix-turn-helix transcriptional regulator [Candidatus Woesearchaeota archaeon]|nr:winged helix-turn-helix transcriptional regulator [Candidatus Woesearchaeota archaeon]